MISSFSLCSIRVAGLAYPATKKELVVYSTFLFYQDFIFLSNTYVSFERSFFSFLKEPWEFGQFDGSFFKQLIQKRVGQKSVIR